MAPMTARSEKLDLRVSPEAKHTLRRAAMVAHQSISEFVLQTALNKAEEVLAEQTQVMLSAQDWQAFVAALDAPPTIQSARLSRLLNEPSVFDR